MSSAIEAAEREGRARETFRAETAAADEARRDATHRAQLRETAIGHAISRLDRALTEAQAAVYELADHYGAYWTAVDVAVALLREPKFQSPYMKHAGGVFPALASKIARKQ